MACRASADRSSSIAASCGTRRTGTKNRGIIIRWVPLCRLLRVLRLSVSRTVRRAPGRVLFAHAHRRQISRRRVLGSRHSNRAEPGMRPVACSIPALRLLMNTVPVDRLPGGDAPARRTSRAVPRGVGRAVREVLRSEWCVPRSVRLRRSLLIAELYHRSRVRVPLQAVTFVRRFFFLPRAVLPLTGSALSAVAWSTTRGWSCTRSASSRPSSAACVPRTRSS